jgi:hypothetical protein
MPARSTGLASMRRRAERNSDTLELTAAPGSGTSSLDSAAVTLAEGRCSLIGAHGRCPVGDGAANGAINAQPTMARHDAFHGK